MRVIKKPKLVEFYREHRQAEEPLLQWYRHVRPARWRNLREMRETFRSADEVEVRSGKKAVVFNMKGNAFRLITAVHYERTVRDQQGREHRLEGKVYLFFLLTHAQYDKQTWKAQL